MNILSVSAAVPTRALRLYDRTKRMLRRTEMKGGLSAFPFIAAVSGLVLLAPCARPQSSDFTIIALPDTQYYSQNNLPAFTAQTQWIVNNASALNVKMVLGLGDIVQNATQAQEYQNADSAVKLLDNANIPYLLAIGNHDYADFSDLSGRTSATTNFNAFFGPARYKNYPWYGGQFPGGSNENFYGTLTINGKLYLFLMLETFPRDSAIAWANSVVASYPSAEVIVVTHAYVNPDSTLASRCDSYNAPTYNVGADSDGDGLWTKFIRQHSNISLVLNGHFTGSGGQGAARRTDLGAGGNIVNQILSDYQDLTPENGNGFLRILKFSPSQDTISVSTFSPYKTYGSLTDGNNQFTVQWHTNGSTNPSGNASVQGRVKDVSSCAGISGATVSSSGGSGTTSSSGNFTLTLPAPATYQLTAQKSGYVSAVKSADAVTGTQLSPSYTKFFLSTQAPGSISGTVTDSSGQPISGATIAYNEGNTVTDANGNYVLSNLIGGTFTITASIAGHQTVANQNVSVASGATTTSNFVLAGTGTISGTVLNNSGQEIAGATVSYSGGSATTASNGSYALLNVPVGSTTVTASATGFQGSSVQNVNVTTGGTAAVNFTLSTTGSAGYSISGSITPASAGAGASVALTGPVLLQSGQGSRPANNTSASVSLSGTSRAGDTILVFTRSAGASVSGITDNQGNTYASVLGPTQWGVAPNPSNRFAQVYLAKNVTGGSALTITVNFNGSSQRPIYVAALEYVGVDPVNPVNATAVGIGKVSSNGAPLTANLTTTVANAKLVATSWDSNESYAVTSNGTGYTAIAGAGASSLTGGPGWANLTEEATAATAGSWSATTSTSAQVDEWAIQLVALAPGPSQTTTADSNGNYTFNNLPDGTYLITPSKPPLGFLPASKSIATNGANVSGLNFTVNSIGTITGTVTGPNGALAGATVSFSGGSTTTGSNGSYTLSSVPAGTVAVTASAGGLQSSTQNVTVTAGGNTVQNFTLAAAVGTVSGTVKNSAGVAIGGATVSYANGSTTSGSNGTYTLSNVPAGSVTIVAAAAGFVSATQTITITSGATTTANFTLQAVAPTFSVSGTISPASGATGTAVQLTGAAPVLVQTARAAVASGFSSATLTFAAPSNAGNTIVVFTRFGGTTVAALTDNQAGGSNAYASVLGPTQWGVAPNATDRYAQVFVAKRITGGTTLSITVRLSALSTKSMYVTALEYSGVDPLNPVYATASGAGTVGANGAPATGNITTAIPNVKLVATSWDANDSYTSTSNGNSYTTNSAALMASNSGGTGFGNLTEDTTATAPGTWSATTNSTQAVTDWAIQLIALNPVTQSAVPDANGNYVFNTVANGAYSVTPTKPGSTFTPAGQAITVNGGNVSGVNFALGTVGTVGGTVTTTGGTALSGATVSYSGGSTTTASNGTYTLSNVPVGTVAVTATAAGFQSLTQNVTVTAGATVTSNFSLTSTAAQTYSIAGTIIPSSIGSGSTVALTGAVPVLVQSAKGSAVAGNTSVTVSFTSPSVAKNTILLFTRFAGARVSSITDNQVGGSNTYTSVVGPTQWGVAPNPNDRYAQVFVAKNIAGGSALSVTFNLAAGSTRAIYVVALEYSGVDPVNPVQATAVGTGKVSQNGVPTTASFTTTVGNAKLVATSWDSNESYNSSGSGATYTTNSAAGAASLTGGPGWSNLTEDTTAANSGSWTATTSSAPQVDDWAIQVVALKPAAYQTTTADTSGNFLFTNVTNGAYTVSPSKTAATFTPASQSVTVNGANLTGVNFSATSTVVQSSSISGTISPSSIGSGSSVALTGAVPVLVQSAKGSAVAGNASVTLSFAAASAARNTIVLFTRFAGTTVSSITDNQAGGSNTYTSVLGPTQWGVAPNPSDRSAQVFVAKNITGGSTLTISFNLSGGSTRAIYVIALEYSGVDPINPIHTTAIGTGKVSVNGAPTTASFTTTIGNTKLVATSWDSNESYAPTGNGANYTTNSAAGAASLTGGPGWSNLTEDRTAATAGTFTATTSLAPQVDDWAIQVVALTPAGAQTTTADTSGNFSFSNVTNGSYIVTPSKTGSTFTPASQSVTVNSANLTGVNFTGN